VGFQVGGCGGLKGMAEENDPDCLQALDESDVEWVSLWKQAARRLKRVLSYLRR
jgi:hypothetical protein